MPADLEELRRQELERRDPLEVAMDAYQARFGVDKLPHLIGVDMAIAAQVLALAAARGRPVHGYLISRLSGSWRNTPPANIEI